MTEQELINIARPLYKDSGPNQWPHILRAVKQAKDAAERTGTRLRPQDLAALYLHDAAKSRMSEYPETSDHGVASSILARKVLRGKLHSRLVNSIALAIAEHDHDVKPRSKISDVLMTGDANKPHLDWVIRKSYMKSKDKLGLRGEALRNNVLDRAKRYAILSGRKNIPTLYASAYADELKIIREQSKALSAANIDSAIAEALRKYKDEDPHA